ncbi:MAG: ArsR/SmtB family transcription factor [Promethearchaeota archaeon]
MATTKKKKNVHIEFEDNELDDVIDIFEALSDHSRVRIISALTRQESLCVSDIADSLDMPITRVSHHLNKLKKLGFVRAKHEGKQVFYSIDDDCITDIMKRARDHVAGK